MKNLVLAVIALAFCSLCWGETPGTASVNSQQEAAALLAQNNGAQAAPDGPLGPADCAFTFTSGADNTFLKYCVTTDGNVSVFESPAGHEHLAVSRIGEGYGICDNSDVNSPAEYFDYAEFGESGNWRPATVVSQNATSVKIARTTSDGIWTLTQTFTQVTGASPSVKIAMALKNNSSMTRLAEILRYANVDADGVSKNNLNATRNKAFGWNSNGVTNPFGLVLQNLTPSFSSGAIQNIPDGPAPCNAVHIVDGPLTATDGSLIMASFFSVPKGASKTVTFSYTGF